MCARRVFKWVARTNVLTDAHAASHSASLFGLLARLPSSSSRTSDRMARLRSSDITGARRSDPTTRSSDESSNVLSRNVSFSAAHRAVASGHQNSITCTSRNRTLLA
jgi:hypothetical protein